MSASARLLVLSHRYLGIAISLLFLLWFASGIVMIYTGGMPSLSAPEQIQHRQAINFTTIAITPAEARAIANSGLMPDLLMVMGRPAYQFPGRNGTTVFADDGILLTSDNVGSQQIAAQFAGINQDQLERVGTLSEVDQWTLGLRDELPLEKFALNDAARTEIYVSSRRGQVVLSTSSSDRFWAWLGAIPHWFYFLPLRKNQALWFDTVVWTASLGTLLAMMGLVLLFVQFKRVRPFSLSGAIPHTSLLRWHYISGLLFGVVTLTWVFSGLLSVEPYRWTNARGLDVSFNLFRGGEIELDNFASIVSDETKQGLEALTGITAIKEINFERIQGEHYYSLTYEQADESGSGEIAIVLIAAVSLESRQQPFDAAYFVATLETEYSAHRIIEQTRLESYDDYYYSRSSYGLPAAPLPVLRIKFDDPAQTWFYVDLTAGEFVYQSHRWGRAERWLYNGFHSLDFRFWYGRRPLWDIGVVLLLLGGLALCGIGCYLGFRRLTTNTRRLFTE